MPRRTATTFDTVRAIGRTLPGVEEGTAWGVPALKLRGTLLACMASHKSAEPNTLVVRLGVEARDAMIADDPRTYYLKPHYAGYPCVLVRLQAIGRDALADLLQAAWRFVDGSRTRRAAPRAKRRTRIAPLVAVLLAAAAHVFPAAQSAPPRAHDLYARAVELDGRGNGAAALALLWEAAGLAPGDGVIQDHLGEALERIGALDAAVEAYRAAVEARPAPRAAANHLVVALVKAGRSEEAIARARAGAADAPRDAERWFTLGLAQADVDFDGAIDSFGRALAIEPRHALARYNLALALVHADRLQPALDQLRQAIAVEPRPEIHYTQGIVYWRQGDLDRAAAALAGAVAARHDYAEAQLALGTVLKARGDLNGAVSALKQAIGLRPDLPAPHIVLAQALTLSGDDAGARRESAEAARLETLARQSQEAATLTAAGMQKLDAGDAGAAADAFRRATRAFDRFAPAHYQLGRALDRLGQHDAARAAFARAQQLNPALVPPR